jgi:RNA polymerase sigma factor (sigma-70 family)
MESSPQELELTPDLLEYARAVALKEAKKCCPKRVSYDDIVQDAIMNLLRKPPKHDPSRGASVKTLIYIIVQRAVSKHVGRAVREGRRFRQLPAQGQQIAVDDTVDPEAGTEDARENMTGLMEAEASDEKSPPTRDVGRRPSEFTSSRYTADDLLDYIDDPKDRQLCLMYLECGANISATALRMGVTEGTIRYRLKLLAPKLVAAGFNPYRSGDTS